MCLCCVCGGGSIGAQLIVAVLCDVAYPGQGLVSALFNDLQIANLYARCCEIGYLKAHLYWRLTLCIIFALHTGQAEMCAHQILLSAGERFDRPNNGILFWRILAATDCCLELWRICVCRHRYNDFHIIGRRSALELRLCLDHIFHARMCMSFDDRFNPD